MMRPDEALTVGVLNRKKQRAPEVKMVDLATQLTWVWGSNVRCYMLDMIWVHASPASRL
jgi:hypothetical protein